MSRLCILYVLLGYLCKALIILQCDENLRILNSYGARIYHFISQQEFNMSGLPLVILTHPLPPEWIVSLNGREG